jgi:hypothetical protein
VISRRWLRATSLGVWCLAFDVGSAYAQNAKRPAPNPARQTVLADSLSVYLITIGEGSAYWEKFGHNALWFLDRSKGINVAYNWGTFDFGAPDFLSRVLINDSKYWVDTVQTEILLDFYRRYDRTIEIQRLNFTPDQAHKAYDYSVWNARQENKFYRYDYFRDNCSTRVRDVIDRALGGALKTWTGSTQVDRSYRSESLRLVDDMKLVQFGIDIALGPPADRQLSIWEDLFVPSRLRDAIRTVRVQVNGSEAPLVSQDTVIYHSTAHEERESFPRLEIPYLVVGLIIGLEFMVVGWLKRRWAPASKVFLIEAAVWQGLVGLLGLVVLLGWLITQHVFWFRNENLFVANPLSIWLAVLMIASIWRPRLMRSASIIAVICAALGVLALFGKVTNVLSQDNAPLILLLLPPHLATAYSMWRASRPAAAVSA